MTRMESVRAEIVAMRSWVEVGWLVVCFSVRGGDGVEGIAYVRADDRRDYGGRHDNASDPETSEDEHAPELIEVVYPGDGHGAAACGDGGLC